MQTYDVLKNLLTEGAAGTQEEIKTKLGEFGISVNQSTISRLLRKLGAIKTTNAAGETIYCLPNNYSFLDSNDSTIRHLLLDIKSNGSMIVIHTTPGSASLIAHLLDKKRPANILGTIAGDDTVFVAPVSNEAIDSTTSAIRSLLSSA